MPSIFIAASDGRREASRPRSSGNSRVSRLAGDPIATLTRRAEAMSNSPSACPDRRSALLSARSKGPARAWFKTLREQGGETTG